MFCLKLYIYVLKLVFNLAVIIGKAGSTLKSRGKGKSPKPDEPVLTPRAKLGGKALRMLKKGKPVDDQLSVDILADAIRYVNFYNSGT